MHVFCAFTHRTFTTKVRVRCHKLYAVFTESRDASGRFVTSKCPNTLVDVSKYSDIFEYGNSVMAKTKTKTTHRLKLTPLEALALAAECLKTLAHPHRLRMVQMLLQGKYTVGELADACDIPSHMASEHLRLMQRCGFLSNEKEGRNVYYRIAETHLASIMNCIEARFGGMSK